MPRNPPAIFTTASVRLDSVDPASVWNLIPQISTHLLICPTQSGPAILAINGQIAQQWPDPLDALRWMQKSLAEPTDRWVGYLSYDCGRWFESFDGPAIDDLNLPYFAFARVGPTVTRASGACPAAQGAGQTSVPQANFTPAEYKQVVAKAIDYIAAGDIFQVNLSQRFDIPTTASPASVYDRLIEKSPAPYSALLDFGDFAVVSHSPELFFSVTPDRKIITRPIKGTRPRGPGMEAELRHSTKDAAELNMIVDLERNDLGRICELGSVRVTQPRTIETHPTLHHGVATVEGLLRPGADFVDLLAATFPGGSITGAPKVRAMQIIDRLEPFRRGPYCGAIGRLAGDGTMQFNIAIRTITMTNGRAYVSVGGGIVADSDPAAEYDETLVKARAMLDALGARAST